MLGAQAFAQQNPLSAYVDRTDLSANDVFTLTIRVNADFSAEPPDLNALSRDFEELGSSISSSFTIINNVSERWNEYRITLRPRRTGSLTIPAFQIAAERTQPITLNVSDTPQSTASLDDFFLTTSISKDEIYVQEELIYTVRIFFASPFDQGAQLSDPRADNALIQRLGSNETSYQEVINGLRYNVIERKYVMFPQSSGSLHIDPITFTATVGRRRVGSIFSTQTTGGRPIDLSSEAHDITVKSKPASYPADATWLPSSNLILQESWSRDLQGIEVGEAVTRNLTLRADGISSALLPDLVYPETDSLKYYPDQANREDLATQNGVTGVRSQGTAIVASEEGDFVLPQIEVPWWNTRTDTLEYARLPAYTLNIINTSGVPANRGNVQVDNSTPVVNTGMTVGGNTFGISPLWYLATAVLALAWLFSTGMWYRTRLALQQTRQGGHPTQEALSPRQSGTGQVKSHAAARPSNNVESALRVLLYACEEKNLSNVRQTLLAWGRAYFDDERILSLQQLKLHLDDAALCEKLDALENAMYGSKGSEEFDCAALGAQVKSMKKPTARTRKEKAAGSFTLPPLYKN